MINLDEHKHSRDDNKSGFYKQLYGELTMPLHKPESKLIRFRIFYDNGKFHEVSRPVKTNVESIQSGNLTYEQEVFRPVYCKKSFAISMRDVAAITIHYDNGDVSIRKFKKCANIRVDVSKKY